jgi:hypothetical protein
MAWDRQIHPLYPRAQGLYERAAVLYEFAAAIFRLPQDRSVFAEALSKQSSARFTLSEGLFNEPPVRCELGEVACEHIFDRISAVEVLGKTHAHRREFVPSHERLS